MPRTPNDDHAEALDPNSPQRQGDKRSKELNPDTGSEAVEPRDQGDQTEDNKRQQE